MNQEHVNQILTYLDKLGEKLGIGINAIWPWFIKQVYITCIGSWVLLILSSIASIVIARGMVRVWFTSGSWREDKDKWAVVRIVALVISLLLFVIGLGMTIKYGLDFLNPEYAAFKDILSRCNSN